MKNPIVRSVVVFLIIILPPSMQAQREHVSGEGIKFDIQDATYMDSPDGSIVPDITTGFRPFTYYWRGPAGFESEDSVLTGLIPGIYVIEVNDKLCGFFADTIEVTAVRAIRAGANVFSIQGVQPNPFTDRATLTLKSSGKQILSIEVYTSNGTQLLHKEVYLDAGETEIPIDLQSAPPGVYILQCCNQINCKLTERIVKMQ